MASQRPSYLKLRAAAKTLVDMLRRLRPRKISALSIYSAGLWARVPSQTEGPSQSA